MWRTLSKHYKVAETTQLCPSQVRFVPGPCEHTKIPRIFAVPSAVVGNETSSKRKKDELLGTRMFLIALFHIRQETMKPIQEPKTMTPVFIGRWTPKILFSLKEKPYRHGELRRRLGGASQRMLTRTLRKLESAGLVAKRATRSNAVAVVEYSLTHLGSTIIAPLRGMCRWAKRYRMNMSANVHLEGA